MYFVGPSWFTGSSLFRLGSSACLPSSLFFFSQEKGSVSSWISWFLFVLAGVSVLVSLLLSSSFLKKRVLFHHGFPGSSSFWRGFRCLSPFFSLLLFSRKGFCSIMDFLVPLRSGGGFGVPLRSGGGFGACLPSSLFFSRKGFCSIMDFLVPPASGWGSGVCLPSFLSSSFLKKRVLFRFLFVLAGVSVLVSLLLSSSFLKKRVLFHSGFPGSSCFGLGFRCVSFFSLFFLRRQECARQFHEFWFAHDLGGNMRCCCLGSMLV